MCGSRVLCGGRRVLCGEGCFVWRECYVGEKGASCGESAMCGEKGAVWRVRGEGCCVERVLCVGVGCYVGGEGCFVWREGYHHPSCVDAEEFMGCFLDGLHEEMVAACQAVTTVAGNEPGDKA